MYIIKMDADIHRWSHAELLFQREIPKVKQSAQSRE